MDIYRVLRIKEIKLELYKSAGSIDTDKAKREVQKIEKEIARDY